MMAVPNPHPSPAHTQTPHGAPPQARPGSTPQNPARPVSDRTTPQIPNAVAPTPATVWAKPTRFLVVDDDETFRTRLVKALLARGLEAQGAGDARQAIDITRQFRPQAAIVDLKMPGGSGLDLLPQLAAHSPGIRIVLLTGYGSIATAVEAVRRGAVNYLTKPLDTDQILAAFDKAPETPSVEATPSLARVEWEHIQRILHDCGGNISLAARKLGLHRRSLQRKLGKLPPLE